MEIRDLRCFMAVCDTGSYSQAARQLYTSRQAVSKTVRAMEAELGYELVELDSGQLRVTPRGRLFCQRASEVVDAFDSLLEGRPSNAGDTAPLRVCTSSTLISTAVPNLFDALERFASDEQGAAVCVVDCMDEECHDAVLSGEVDAALMLCTERPFKDCRRTCLLEVPFGLAVNRQSPLAAKGSVDVADLRGLPLVTTYGFDFKCRPLIEGCARLGFAPERSHCLDSLPLALQVVSHNQGAVVMCYEPRTPVPDNVMLLPFSDPHLQWGVYLIYRDNGPRHALLRHLERFLMAQELAPLKQE